LVELPGRGPALARNRGAELARAPLLLFLDDDVEPLGGWLAAHVEQHERSPGGAVIGSYPPLPTRGGEFRRVVRHWWMQHFDELERPGHRFAFSDLLTGNISMSRAVERARRPRSAFPPGTRGLRAGAAADRAQRPDRACARRLRLAP
jgi:glycosyltransferase involved in cell wall biosynthesis